MNRVCHLTLVRLKYVIVTFGNVAECFNECRTITDGRNNARNMPTCYLDMYKQLVQVMTGAAKQWDVKYARNKQTKKDLEV